MAGAFPGDDPWANPDSASLVVIGRLRQDVTAGLMQPWLEAWLRRRFPPPSDAAPAATPRFAGDPAAAGRGRHRHVDADHVRLRTGAPGRGRQHHEPDAGARTGSTAGDCRPTGAGRRQMACGASADRGEPGARGSGGGGWPCPRCCDGSPPSAILVASWPAAAEAPPENILVPIDPDVRVIAFLAAAAVASAVLIALAPAGRLARLRLTSVARGQASSDARGSRLRSGLVAVQIARVLFLVGALGLVDQSTRLANPPLELSYDRVSVFEPIARCEPRSRRGCHSRPRSSRWLSRGGRHWDSRCERPR